MKKLNTFKISNESDINIISDFFNFKNSKIPSILIIDNTYKLVHVYTEMRDEFINRSIKLTSHEHVFITDSLDYKLNLNCEECRDYIIYVNLSENETNIKVNYNKMRIIELLYTVGVSYSIHSFKQDVEDHLSTSLDILNKIVMLNNLFNHSHISLNAEVQCILEYRPYYLDISNILQLVMSDTISDDIKYKLLNKSNMPFKDGTITIELADLDMLYSLTDIWLLKTTLKEMNESRKSLVKNITLNLDYSKLEYILKYNELMKDDVIDYEHIINVQTHCFINVYTKNIINRYFQMPLSDWISEVNINLREMIKEIDTYDNNIYSKFISNGIRSALYDKLQHFYIKSLFKEPGITDFKLDVDLMVALYTNSSLIGNTSNSDILKYLKYLIKSEINCDNTNIIFEELVNRLNLNDVNETNTIIDELITSGYKRHNTHNSHAHFSFILTCVYNKLIKLDKNVLNNIVPNNALNNTKEQVLFYISIKLNSLYGYTAAINMHLLNFFVYNRKYSIFTTNESDYLTYNDGELLLKIFNSIKSHDYLKAMNYFMLFNLYLSSISAVSDFSKVQPLLLFLNNIDSEYNLLTNITLEISNIYAKSRGTYKLLYSSIIHATMNSFNEIKTNCTSDYYNEIIKTLFTTMLKSDMTDDELESLIFITRDTYVELHNNVLLKHIISNANKMQSYRSNATNLHECYNRVRPTVYNYFPYTNNKNNYSQTTYLGRSLPELVTVLLEIDDLPMNIHCRITEETFN